MVVCWSALARALPKGGKWSFCTLKGWVRRGGRWVHVHVMVSTTSNYCMYMYIRFIDMLCGLSIWTIPWVVCRHTLAPASPEGGKWSFRTLKVGQAWGWLVTCSCDGPYSCTIHYFCNKICSMIPRGTIELNRRTAACRPALAPAFPRGGKWRFCTLRGLARRWDWKMRARVSVNIMHNNLVCGIIYHALVFKERVT